MTIFTKRDFLGDEIQVSEERIKASDLLGFGYTIPDLFWQAEQRLPSTYVIQNLSLRNFGQSKRFVSWPEIDIILNMETSVIPIGWRLVSSLYHDQELIPPEWLGYLLGGNAILFPYASCYLKRGSEPSPIYCPAFFYDTDIDSVECKAMGRQATGATLAIGVYQI